MGQEHFDLVNLDFEFALNGISHKNAKNIIAEFEYIYFFIKKDDDHFLVPHRDYSEIYRSYIEGHGYKVNIARKFNNVKNWWGDLEDIELSRKLNSKIFSYNYSSQFNHVPETRIILDLNNINHNDGSYILKNDTGVSGNGNYIFSIPGKISEEHISKKIGKGPYLLQPFLKRVVDFGITLNLEDGSFFANENFMGQFGRFAGGRILAKEKLEKILKPFGGFDYFNFQKMITDFKEMGARGTLQFDNFIYRCSQSDEIKLYFMCEINYRKTMGLVVKNLGQRNTFGEWHIFPKQLKEKDHHALLKKYFDNKNILITSPENNRFLSIYFSAQSQIEIEHELERMKSELRIESSI